MCSIFLLPHGFLYLLPQLFGVLYFKSFVLPLFRYGDMIWGDKNNDTLMRRLPILQNKAAIDWPIHSSATDALHTLKWFNCNLSKRRLYHRYLYVLKCENSWLKSHLGLISLHDVHRYNTRNAKGFRLLAVRTNWGKQ